MSKNNLSELNAILFQEMRKLSEPMTEEETKVEVMKSKAITDVAKTLITGVKLELESTKLKLVYGKDAIETIPDSLQITSGKSDE